MARLVYCLAFAILVGLRAEPHYDLILIEANRFGTNGGPQETNAVAVAINQQGTVVGAFVDTNGMSATFLWRDGAVTKVEAEYPTHPRAINNKDEVVGAATVLGEDFAYARAWLNSRGTNYLLGGTNINLDRGSWAYGINDNGVVVGSVGSDGFVFRPAEVRFPDLGGGPCWGGFSMLTVLNNNGVVLGHTDHVAYRWMNYSLPNDSEYLGGIMPAAINNSNVIAGSFETRPAKLDGTNVKYLHGPGNRGQVVAMNDAGVVLGNSERWHDGSNDGIIGTFPGWRTEGSIIWKGATGLDLATLVDLPDGADLEPVGINNAGWIAATMDTGSGVVPVVLKPRAGRSLPDIAMTAPEDKGLVTNGTIEARVTIRSERPVAKVTYVLYAQHYAPSHGTPPCWWYPPSTNSIPVATNVVTEAPFTTLFENITPGQYAYEAAMEDSEGVVAFSPQAEVVVAEPARLRIRESWRNEIEVALEGRGGYTHRLEVSEDLVNWEGFDGTDATTGGVFAESEVIRTNAVRRFFRAVVVAEDRGAFPNAAEFSPEPQPPVWLVDRTLRLDYGIFNDEIRFESATLGKSVKSQGTFEYVWEPEQRKLVLRWNTGTVGVEEIVFRPGTWWEFSGRFSSRFTAEDGRESNDEGTFQLTPDLPIFPF